MPTPTMLPTTRAVDWSGPIFSPVAAGDDGVALRWAVMTDMTLSSRRCLSSPSCCSPSRGQGATAPVGESRVPATTTRRTVGARAWSPRRPGSTRPQPARPPASPTVSASRRRAGEPGPGGPRKSTSSASSAATAATTSLLPSRDISHTGCTLLRQAKALAIWHTAIVAKAEPDATKSRWSSACRPSSSRRREDERESAERHERLRRTEHGQRPDEERAINQLADRPAVHEALRGGSAPRARAGSMSVPMSSASTCSTPMARGKLPPVIAHTANGVSSATLSVRW